MTLALYGKSRRRQTVLVGALFGSIFLGMMMAFAASIVLSGGTPTADAQAAGTVDITKVESGFNGPTYTEGENLGWDITINVNGSDTSEIYQIVDDVPPGFTVILAYTEDPFLTCTAPPADPVICTLAAGAPVGPHAVQITAQVDGAPCGQHTNTAVLRNAQQQQIDSASDAVPVPCGTTTVDKSDTGDGTYAVEEDFDFLLTFTVSTSDTAQAQTWNDLLPAGLTLLGFNDFPVDELSCSGNASGVTCTLAAGASPGTYSILLSVEGTGAVCGPITNTVRTGSTAGQGTFAADETVTITGCPSNVTWVKSSGNLNPSVNDVHVDWYFDISNTSGTAGSVTIFDADTSFVNSTCSNNPNVEIANDTYKCDIAGSPNPPGSYSIQMIVRGPTLPGFNVKCDNYQATNEAWIPGNFNSSDTAQVNHTATGPAKDCLTVTKTQDALGITGGKAYWNINIANTYDSPQAVSLWDSDAFMDAPVAECGGDTILGNGINCTVGANSTLTLQVYKNVPAATCDSQQLANTVRLWIGTFPSGAPPQAAPDKTADGAAYTISGEGSAECLTVTKTKGASSPPTWTIGIASTADVSVPVWVVDTGATFMSAAGGTCAATAGLTDMSSGISCSVAANSTLSIGVIKTTPPATCEGASVSNTVWVWFGQHSETPTSAPDKTGDGGSHEGVNANPVLCGSVIQICKLWRINEGGVGGAVASFTFDVSDTSETEAVTINGVTEGSEAACVNVFVNNGLVEVNEHLLSGFLNPTWTVENLGAGGGTTSGNGYDVDPIAVGPLGCGRFVFESLIGALQRSIFAVVVPPPVGSGSPVCRITFTNEQNSQVSPSGGLRVEKYLDINGDGDASDPGEGPINGWDMTISGPDFNGTEATSIDGSVVKDGLMSGDVYTVTEEMQPGFTVVKATVDGVSFGATTVANATIPEGGFTVVAFFNKPNGETIIAHKVAQTSHNGGPNIDAPGDDDGWQITLSSANCAINITLPTDSNGNATFTNLPLCSDYVVSENTVNAASPGFVPAGPTSFSGQTPNGQTLTFVNRRATFDPPCITCSQVNPTPTPPTPTATPVTPTVPATNTTLPATNTPTATPTLTPVQGVQGERTPGITPIAPSTGEALTGSTAGGFNLALVAGGLLALASGIGIVALGRKRR